MATNELNELKINVNITQDAVINAKVTPNAEIVAKVTSGARGKSAYEVWLDEGHTGSQTDFLNWLKSDGFVYTELQSLKVWTINHNMGKYPSVTIVDSVDRVVIGDVRYIDENTLEVSFVAEFSGQAFLN